MEKISFIGCGNMGYAIAKALSTDPNWEITLYSPNEQKTKEKALALSVKAEADITKAIKGADYIVLAVKPQILPSLYETLRLCGKDKIFISIAAGISLATLEEALATKKVIRYMPNLAASEKASVTAITYSEELDETLKTKAYQIASAFGSAFYLPESQFKAFIGISGSAIAYVFEFLHALALGGTKAGIAYPTSLAIATDTLNSAVALEKASKANPIELMSKVCSAGGTTIDGIEALADGKFDSTVINAVMAAVNKNILLERAQEKK